MEANNYSRYIIRPVRETDLSAICEIAMQVGPSISLPNDSKTIQKKIDRSLASFSLSNKPDERLFFLILEDLFEHRILGTAAIEARAGSHLNPFFNFTVGRVASISKTLNRTFFHQVLYLANNYEEASLLGTLYLNRKCRGLGLGQFLSRSRCLFIAQFPDFFSDIIVANMRGVFNEENKSPFWGSIGYHFLKIDFYKAYFLYSTEGAQMIYDLAPKYPIYVSLLPKEAQKVIGETHQNTKAALHLLEKEGFVYRDVIDVFDGGPIVEVPKKLLKAMRDSHLATVVGIVQNISDQTMEQDRSKDSNDGIEPGYENEAQQVVGKSIFMISNTKMDFRTLRGKIQFIELDKVIIEESVAKILDINKGDKIRYYAL